jgi:hypothetical protein
MGLGIAVPQLLSVALSCLGCLVGQAIGNATDEVHKDDVKEPYDPSVANATPTTGSNDRHQDFGYGTDSLDEYAGYGEDSMFYYSDEFDVYYNTYGMYADGYDYFDSNASGEADCNEDDKGKVSLKGVNIMCFHGSVHVHSLGSTGCRS